MKFSSYILILPHFVLSFGILPVERKLKKEKRKDNKPFGVCRIIIDKSDYILKVLDENGLYATYPVVFGKEPDRDKFQEGDRRTPEGIFTITLKWEHANWRKMLLLNYPTKDSYEKFQRRKKEGKIKDTSAAKIGGAIGIHGTYLGDDYLIDKFTNWTNGCISLKNAHIDDLYSYINTGTVVTIRK